MGSTPIMIDLASIATNAILTELNYTRVIVFNYLDLGYKYSWKYSPDEVMAEMKRKEQLIIRLRVHLVELLETCKHAFIHCFCFSDMKQN